MDDKYGYVGIRDKSLRFVFFAKYNHISAQMLDWPLSLSLSLFSSVSQRMLYAQVLFYFFIFFVSSLALYPLL